MLVLLLWPKMSCSVICPSVMWVSIHPVYLFLVFHCLFCLFTDIFGTGETWYYMFSGTICFWEKSDRCRIWLQPNGFCGRWKGNLVRVNSDICVFDILIVTLSNLYAAIILLSNRARIIVFFHLYIRTLLITFLGGGNVFVFVPHLFLLIFDFFFFI